MTESFAEFAASFSYGSRTDLAFKFLKKLPPGQAAEFLAELLRALGETIDDGDGQRLVDLAYEWQVRGYTPQPDEARAWTYDGGPFAPLPKPVPEARVALLTSSGHFVDDPEPFGVAGMTQEEAIERIGEFMRAEPELSEIPTDTPPGALRVRHGGYDIRGAQRDPDVAFPLARLRELAAAGDVGELVNPAFSFVGAASQKRIMSESVPKWTARLRETGADAVLLVPV